MPVRQPEINTRAHTQSNVSDPEGTQANPISVSLVISKL
jgi:hypothetical protein